MIEITFIVEESEDGGFIARALGQSIFTEGDNREHLLEMIRDAVKCHFEDDERPGIIHLHYVKDEVLAL